MSVVDNVLPIVRESLEIFFRAEFGISTVNSREQVDIFSFAFLDAFCIPANSRRVTVSRDCVRVGRFLDSRANVPGGGQRVGSFGAESSES